MSKCHFFLALQIVFLALVPSTTWSGNAAFRQYDVRNGLFCNYARLVIPMPDRRIMAYVDGAFCMYDGNGFQNLPMDRTKAASVQSFFSQDYAFDKEGHLWVRLYHQLFVIDVNTCELLDAKKLLAMTGMKDALETFFIDDESGMWMLTRKGQLYHRPKGQKRATLITTLTERLPNGQRVTACDIIEVDGIHYVFLNNGEMLGINAKRRKVVRRRMVSDYKSGYRLKASLWRDSEILLRLGDGLHVLNVVNDKDKKILGANIEGWTVSQGELWLVANSGTYHYDRNLNLIEKFSDVDNPQSISSDWQGGIWVCSFRNGIFYHARTKEKRLAQYLAVQPLNLTVPQPTGFPYPLGNGLQLVRTHNNILGVADKRGKMLKDATKQNPDIFRFRYLVCAAQLGREWLVGSQNGFFYYDTQTNKIDIDKARKLNDNTYSDKCNCMLPNGKGGVWIGTQNGLFLLRGDALIHYGNKDGLANSCIQSLAIDKAGRLWISTAGGLAYMSSEGDIHFVLRNSDEDMHGGSFLERNVGMMGDTAIVFDTTNGAISICPSVLNDVRKAETPVLMSFNCMANNGEPISILPKLKDGSIDLDYNENYISVNIVNVNYDSSHRMIYRYRLSGIDHDWVTTDVGRGYLGLNYKALPPGNYELRIQISSYGIDWGEPLVEKIHIARPWWLSWYAITLYALGFAALVGFVVRSYINLRREKMESEQRKALQTDKEHLNEMKFRFFTNMSHEFRTPLTLILTPLQQLLERSDLPQGVEKQLDVMKRNAQHLNTLISHLLDFRSLEQGGARLQPTAVQLSTLFNSIEPAFMMIAKERGINFLIDKERIEHSTFHIDVAKFQTIINNLLSNAFKFTPNGGEISIRAEILDSELLVSVADTGVGIKADELPHIFERFYQTGNEQQGEVLNTGSGIGLNLVKGYIELMDGDISVESKEGKGTTFTIRIPDTPAKTEERQETKLSKATGDEEAEETDNRVRLLIVEDNKDFRDFMVDALSNNQYRIFAARDGEEGLSTARVAHPDIIVSDVMMPRMDGYQLCREVKKAIDLSHIPIVLLTAKNTDEGRMEGYQSGADAYITKPFNMNVLQSCIQMLLEQRQQRQQRFQQDKEADVNPQKLTITPLDEKFLKKAMDCVRKNISDSEYDVPALSRDMAMERSTLYRKMVAIVGKTPLQFIHSIRMKRALQLIEEGDHTLTDIAFMVGYNSTKYFSRQFKSEYGKLPSQWTNATK